MVSKMLTMYGTERPSTLINDTRWLLHFGSWGRVMRSAMPNMSFMMMRFIIPSGSISRRKSFLDLLVPRDRWHHRTWAGTCRILACTRTAFITGDFRRPLGTFGVPSPSSTLALVFCVVWPTRCVRPCGLEHAVTRWENRAGLHLRCRPAAS